MWNIQKKSREYEEAINEGLNVSRFIASLYYIRIAIVTSIEMVEIV